MVENTKEITTKKHNPDIFTFGTLFEFFFFGGGEGVGGAITEICNRTAKKTTEMGLKCLGFRTFYNTTKQISGRNIKINTDFNETTTFD
jgi:hypothetical protein